MKAISTRVTKALPVGAEMVCSDNTGAKIIKIISVMGFKGKRRTKPTAGVASQVSVKVIKGDEKVRHEVHRAVIIRQRREYRRADGTHISFEDNAAVLVNEKGEARGTLVKGPVAREAVERFSTIGKIANQVV
jgi:large subunit ribosomal protein L14